MTNQLTHYTKNFRYKLPSVHDDTRCRHMFLKWVIILLTNPYTAGNVNRTEDFHKMKLLPAGMLKDITVYMQTHVAVP